MPSATVAPVTRWRDYENGIADVHKVGTRSGVERQIDVLVAGAGFDPPDILVVDCKRWSTKVDVGDVDQFCGLLDDLGVTLGLLVSTKGFSLAAARRAENSPGARVRIIDLQELAQWRPEGTVTVSYRVSRSQQRAAEDALRHAGYRVLPSAALPIAKDEVLLEVFRHYGLPRPSAEIQGEQMRATANAMTTRSVTFALASSGVTIGGGTPAHKWVPVRFGNNPPISLLVATEQDLTDQLARQSEIWQVPVHAFAVERPVGWPVSDFFTLRVLHGLWGRE
jgi:hypothetical protein